MRNEIIGYMHTEDRGVIVLPPAAAVCTGAAAGDRGKLSGPHTGGQTLKEGSDPLERMTMELIHFISRRKKILLMPLISLLLFMSLFYLLTEADILTLLSQLGR